MTVLIVTIIMFPTIILVAGAINGWALAHLWEWFMVPLGLPGISVPWAFGIAILIGLLTNHNLPQKDDTSDPKKVLLQAFLRPLMSLAIGYAVKRWFMGGA